MSRAHVVIAGTGIAGLEAALALQAFAGDRVAVEMVGPGARFTMPAAAPGLVFGIGSEVDAPVETVVVQAGAALRRGRLVAVDSQRHLIMLAGGELLTYDRLVVAVGARAEPQLPEALTFTGYAEVGEVRAIVDGIAHAAARGARTDLVIVAPPGCGWPLAAYELAVMTREHLAEQGHPDAGRVTVVTAEDTPLAVFGPQASDAIARRMREAGVDVRAGAAVRSWEWGRLELTGGETLQADRVIALPALRGPGISGLPGNSQGFVRTTRRGTARGAPDVWVVGDAGTFPVKQGGIACQQADSAAAGIARELGADIEELPFDPVLRGWMWDKEGGRFLRADLGGGHTESPGVTDRSPLWSPVAKVAGRFLAPFLEQLRPGGDL